MTSNLNKSAVSSIKPKSDFRALIVYPNLPLMLVPGVAIGLFTRILKDQGYGVEMFETTHYDTDETNYSETKINYSENRVRLLNVRKFDVKKDLNIDLKQDMLGDFRAKVQTFKPDIMLFSVVEDTFFQALTMLDAVEDLKIPHLMGGVFPTMAPEVAISADSVKMIGLGEGEESIVKVSEAIRTGERLDNIPSTWFKDDDGKVFQNLQAPLVELDDVVPDFSLFDESRFNRPMGGEVFRMIPAESYRGCPYSCTYCNSPSQRLFAKKTDQGNFLRRTRIGKLRDHLAELQDKYQPEFFFFVDDSFLARPRAEIFEFCDMYEEFNLPFYFNTRAENTDAEILNRLKEVNCYRMAFGIECGNEQYRQKMLRRKISNAEIIDRFSVIAEGGIAFSLNAIIGFPGETRELVFDTIELIRSIHGYDALTSFIFTPYHGTALRKTAESHGWIDPDVVTVHNTSRSLLKMPAPYLSADDIDGLIMTLPLYCYFPKSEWENLRRAETPDEEGLQIRKYYSDIYSQNFLNEHQDMAKTFFGEDAENAATDLRADYRVSPQRMTTVALDQLMSPMVGH